MSLYGRNIIDRIKRVVSNHLTLPVPPYHSPAYWEKVYSQLDENDVFEWGDINFESQLKSFTYKINQEYTNEIRQVYGDKVETRRALGQEGEMDFHRVLFEDNYDNDDNDNGDNDNGDDDTRSSIVVLGCGNSRLGEDILHYYLDMNFSDSDSIKDKHKPSPKVIQFDISTHVVNSMTKRYQKYVDKDLMSIVQDDATQFTLVSDKSFDGVVDKGLVDALFCADQNDMVQQIMGSVHRTLKAGKVFLFFSFSRPEYLLKHTVRQSGFNENEKENEKDVIDMHAKWSAVDILELNDIFIYRFVKADDDDNSNNTNNNTKMVKRKSKKKRTMLKKRRQARRDVRLAT